MDMDSAYKPATALTAIAGVFLIIGALSFIVVTADIIWRKGWRSMMWIMIPAYPINATYLGPLTLYVYFRYGRPSKPSPTGEPTQSHCHSTKETDVESTSEEGTLNGSVAPSKPKHCHKKDAAASQDTATPSSKTCHETPPPEPAAPASHCCSSKQKDQAPPPSDPEKEPSTPHCHSGAATRPMLATVLVGVHHCGAGCVLGDIVGEWLVYGTNAQINGQSIWVELLVDYAFALLFGIIFQYFSIAPMSGEYGPKSVWRAAKADILSLTSFEVGAFGWMVIYQVGIWGYKLEMTTWAYWWMMQVGMCFGFATAIPVNWLLIKYKIKEPCC